MTGKRLEIGVKTKNLSQKFPALRLGSAPAPAEERRDLHKRGKVVSILEAEDPDMVTAYLRSHLECGHTSHAAHLIQALLNIRKEDSYDL